MPLRYEEERGDIFLGLIEADGIGIDLEVTLSILRSCDERNWRDDAEVDGAEQRRSPTSERQRRLRPYERRDEEFTYQDELSIFTDTRKAISSSFSPPWVERYGGNEC